MASLILVLAGVAIALAVAYLLNRTRRSVPIATNQQIPTHINRNHFNEPARPYLVVVFTARSCDTCAQVVQQALGLASDQVVVQEVEYVAQKRLHQLYQITAVPLVLFANTNGAVLRSIAGPTTTSQFESALANVVESNQLGL